MDRKIKKSACLIFLFIVLASLSKAQNIFDANNSLKYGRFLEQNQKFEPALKEYENALKIYNDNDTLRLKIIQLNLKVFGKYAAVNKIESFFANKDSMPLLFLKKYCTYLILSKQNFKLDTIINNSKILNDSLKYFYHFNNLIFKNNWGTINNATIPNSFIQKNYKDILSEIKQAKYKSPFIAASMSALLPGSGKFYTGNARDGIFSLMIVAINAVEAYRGFNKYGTSSVLGWVCGGIALGYYSGGIYGSWSAARKYNNDFNNKIHDETEEILLNH